MRLSALIAELREAQRWFEHEDPQVIYRGSGLIGADPEKPIAKVKIRDGGKPVVILCESKNI